MNAIAQAEADALRGDIEHHFCGGVYAKSIHFKRGDWAVQHMHNFDHMSIVASGFVTVNNGGKRMQYGPGSVIKIPAGVVHEVYANTDAHWLCIHATEETDPAKVDHTLIDHHAPPPSSSSER